MSTPTAPSLRCPRCSATLRTGTEWCSLCYADLRPRELVVPAPAPTTQATPVDAPGPDASAQDRPSAASGQSQRPAEPGPASRPQGKHAKRPGTSEFGAATAPPDDEVERLAQELLAELAATEGGNPLGAASGLVDSSAKRVLLMVGGGVAAMLVIFVLMFAVGALV